MQRIEDFAAKAGMDPLEVFKLNLQYAPKARRDFTATSAKGGGAVRLEEALESARPKRPGR